VARGALIFGPFQLDERTHVLCRDGERVVLGDRAAALLWMLASAAGTVVSKDALVTAGWSDVAVTDNSVEQAISILRRVLGPRPDGRPYIETVPRRGYRFVDDVQRVIARESDAGLDALLAPHRAWVEGRAALESLAIPDVLAAKEAFARALAVLPDYTPAHIGLANACAFLFESTRADPSPDRAALEEALRHAREGCRLDPESAEAWATLAFVLHRSGAAPEALASARRAVSLEPENWRHQLRLAIVSWGDERLRSAHRTRHLLPGLALTHWLAATVHVARQAFDAAEHELDAGCAAQDLQDGGSRRFNAVGLHWLRGLLCLQQGNETRAAEAFQRELSFNTSGHLYQRECQANTWYALGALSLRRGAREEAIDAFEQALRSVPGHRPAMVGKAVLTDMKGGAGLDGDIDRGCTGPESVTASVEVAGAAAVRHALNGQHERAAGLVHDALRIAPAGSHGWLIPVEPLLMASAHPTHWTRVFTLLRNRAL
jgi:DNA-binding winged helix-turn-helix (wHTH) protein